MQARSVNDLAAGHIQIAGAKEFMQTAIAATDMASRLDIPTGPGAGGPAPVARRGRIRDRICGHAPSS